ncbi:MAG: hypothetical protein Q8Q49_04665 [bacterium]|nr:hypothetical protein [bacterium]
MNQLHINDRRQLANLLSLPLEQFDTLLQSANHAHSFIKAMGPFYGPENVNEPTFRITAEPVRLPLGSKKILTDFGNDLLHLGRALRTLPKSYQNLLGDGMDIRVPLTWRIDSIIDAKGALKVNEIEGIDSVSALMMIEQLAYHLQLMEETTIARIIAALEKMFLVSPYKSALRLAIIRNLYNNPFTPNAKRFIEIVHELSKGAIQCELFDIEELKNKVVIPDWESYAVVLNESYSSPAELGEIGITRQQLLASGNYNAMVNKGLFALFYDPELRTFWNEKLGEERNERLRQLMIPSYFVASHDALDKARADGKVVKVTWAKGNMIVANRAKGVAVPLGDIMESQDERWNLLHEFIDRGYRMIAQDFVEPKQISAYLRKKGTSLELVEWYNRVCVKYVVNGNPNVETFQNVFPTAVEVTLGPEVIPAGRKCAFTAGMLS